MTQDVHGDGFDASRAELFESLGHVVRIGILESLRERPLGFSELKKSVGLESSGHLQFHLDKLGDLVMKTPEGDYTLTDEGRGALILVTTMRRAGDLGRDQGSGLGLRRNGRTLFEVALVGLVVMVALFSVGGQQEASTLRTEVMNLQARIGEIQRHIADYPWLFRGAYAIYEGESIGSVAMLGPASSGSETRPHPFRLEARLEVLGHNGTYAKLFFSEVAGNAWVGDSLYDGDWVELGKGFRVYRSALTRLNETDLTVEGLGKRRCTVYSGSPPVTMVYVDDETGWPLRLQYSMHFHAEFDIELVLIETNIPLLVLG